MANHNFTLPTLLGHRGIAARAPENTLEGFRRAKAAGMTWVEFDVMLTADGVPVVIHDNSVKRTTNGRGQVGKMQYAELARLDAGSWFSPEFSGEQIPRFIDVIELLGKLHLQANVEIKPYPGADILTAKRVLKEIAEAWPRRLLPPLISSFSYPAMKVALRQAPDLPRGLCLSRWLNNWPIWADELQCNTIHLPVSGVKPDRIKAIHQTGRGVLVYTVNSVNKARELYAQGVDGLFSDCPDEIAQALF